MKTEVKKTNIVESSSHRQLSDFYLKKLTDKINTDTSEKNLLIAELKELTEGKNIVLKNANI